MRIRVSLTLQSLIILTAIVTVLINPAVALMAQFFLGLYQIGASLLGLIRFRFLPQDAQKRLKAYLFALLGWIALYVSMMTLDFREQPVFGFLFFVIPWSMALFYLVHEVLIMQARKRRTGNFLPNLQF